MIERGVLPRIRPPKWESERAGKESWWYGGWTGLDMIGFEQVWNVLL